MNERKGLMTSVVFFFGLITAGAANAAIYNYAGIITTCTSGILCQDPILAGSSITGYVEIDTAVGQPFNDANIVDFSFSITSATAPAYDFFTIPGNPNPSTGSSGTRTLTGFSSGSMLQLAFQDSPLSDSGVFAIFDLATGAGQTCASFLTSGCVDPVVNVTVIPGVRPSSAEWESQRQLVLTVFPDTDIGPYPSETEWQEIENNPDGGLDVLFPGIYATTETQVVTEGTVLSTFEGAFTQAPAVVPLPAAAWLFGSAILGLIAVGRRKQA
jgi:hypothetical protein